MKALKLAVCSAALLACFETSAHAYLDPGTGSIILQAVIASVASSLFVIKMYWHKFKGLLGMNRAGDDEGADAAQ
jgi:hypothetical protein